MKIVEESMSRAPTREEEAIRGNDIIRSKCIAMIQVMIDLDRKDVVLAAFAKYESVCRTAYRLTHGRLAAEHTCVDDYI